MNTNNKYNTSGVRPVSDFPVSDSPLPDVTLMAAFEEAYVDCLRKKSMTASALRFRVDETAELTRLALEVERGEYVPLPSRAFVVHRPVPREIIAARFRDRIAEHYMVMRLKPLAERMLPDGAYSCRDGRGNLAAVFRLRDELRRASRGYTRPCWAARYDLRAFFMSIDRRRLYEDFVRLIDDGYEGDDKDTLLYLTRIITLTCPADRAGRALARPPSLSICLSPVTSSTESTVRSMSDLNTEWLRAWSSPARITSAVRLGLLGENTRPRDRHRVTRAMFSMLE